MAWATEIVDMEQVDYRLQESAGCFVKAPLPGEETTAPDAMVDYRMRPEGDAALVWMGSGLKVVGLVAEQPLDEAGKVAARLLMNGCDPTTGARLVKPELRAHEKAQLTGARLLEAFERKATETGVEPAALLEGKPKQQRQLVTLTRMVKRWGEAHRVSVDTLHRLARAAGIDLADVYGAQELAEAYAHADERVDVRVRGWDVVTDLPKSDSVVQALMGSLDGREFRALVHQARREAFAEFERWIGYGVAGQDGRRVRIATGGLLAWSMEHQSARPVDNTPGDPHLHLHNVIVNMALCEDGKWRSIANSGQDLHRHLRALDGLFKARVRALAYERFGIVREQDARTRAWEIVGIPADLRAHFSRRSAEVNAKAGADASREDKMRVSAATRHARHDTGALDLRAVWRERAEDLGVDVDAMLTAAAPGPPGPDSGIGLDGPGGGPRIPPPDQLAAVVFAPETGLTAHDKEFSRAQLLAAVAQALPFGIGPEPGALDALADRVLAVEGYAVRLPHRGSAVMSNTARYTTADILAAEQVIIEQARTRYADGSARLTADQAAAAIDVFEVGVGYELSAEQRDVVDRLLTAGHGIDAVVGVAGAGKTTLMQACRIAWDATGTTYAGACVSAVAAQNLHTGSGIPARTITSWLQRIADGPGLSGVDVLVLDEAAMVDDRSVARLLTEAARTGTKVVAIGDPQQLQAIGPGGGFAEVHRLVGGAVLTENRRQQDAAERAALQVWREGEREQALQMLAAGGRVHATDTAEQAHAQMLAAWNALRTRWPDPHEQLARLVVLAARNSDVDALNAGAQALRRVAGELGAAHTYALPGGGRLTLAVGDLVRVRQNDYRSRRDAGPDLLNGYRAVVTAIDVRHRVQITWHRSTADGSTARESAWLEPDQIAGGALSLGYAMTIAASQGLTTEIALTYGHGANAYALYPGITRARSENHLWLPLAVLEDEQTRARLGESRSDKERLERAIHAFARFLGQSRPDGMVSDLLHEPPAPAPLPRQRDLSAEGARAESGRRLRQAHMARAARAKSVFLFPRQAQDQAQREEEARRAGEKAKRLLARIQAGADEGAVPSWKARVYGDLSWQELNWRITEGEQLAADADTLAAAAEAQARELAARLDHEAATGQPTRGQRFAAEAGQVLDRAEARLATARKHLETAVIAARRAEDHARHLAKLAQSEGKSRIALRLAGTSRKEHRELTRRLSAERAAYLGAEANARRKARQALREAWDVLKQSPFAEPLGAANQPVPDHVEKAAEQFVEMRSVAARHGHSMDKRDRDEVGRAARRADQYRAYAASHRAQAADARAEKALRAAIAQKFPELHDREVRSRRELQQARQAAQHQQAATAYPQPQQSRGWGLR